MKAEQGKFIIFNSVHLQLYKKLKGESKEKHQHTKMISGIMPNYGFHTNKTTFRM